MKWVGHPVALVAGLLLGAYIFSQGLLNGSSLVMLLGILLTGVTAVSLCALVLRWHPEHPPEPAEAAEGSTQAAPAAPEVEPLLDLTLADVDCPAARDILAGGPGLWEPLVPGTAPPMVAATVASHVWITCFGEDRRGSTWTVSLEELDGLVDLDAEEDQDPFIANVRRHLLVNEVWREERGRYGLTASPEFDLEAMARITARATLAARLVASPLRRP
ncbi:hypothetical protein [Nocardioides sp. Kera G14]|uniref:hypothetical protein n=1 Tax=Nocardioides sp. Kera G14 TaxID=2884264 RepID=UPI001D1136E3|nr:hypothetical protein [Nocardioides sp. Kera G14]UDY22224.1 hypothetical protein LH076_09015 [Nocardioides sp. Kera G14]